VGELTYSLEEKQATGGKPQPGRKRERREKSLKKK